MPKSLTTTQTPENLALRGSVRSENEPPNLGELKQKSIRGGLVTLLSQAISTVVHIASTVILARMLTPADFGTIAMVTAITSFAGLFRDLGLSAAAIQSKELSHGVQTNLFWLNVCMGLVLTLLVSTASPLVAWFYQKPELQAVTIALSLNFLIGSFGTQHGAMLSRHMKFAPKAVASIAGSVVSLSVAVTLAYYSLSYWALVASSLTGSLCTTLLLMTLSSFRPGFPAPRHGVGTMLKFGAHVTAFDLVNYFHRNLDNVLLGRFWGPEALGIYSRAYALLMFPIQAIRGPINAVAFPAMSRLQQHPREFRAYYRKSTELIACISMPAIAHLAIFASPVITVLLGPDWGETVPIYQLLAVASFLMPIASTRGLVWLSLGFGRLYFGLGFANAMIVSFAFCVGIYWGPIGIAAGYVVATYAMQIPGIVFLARYTPITFHDLLVSIYKPTLLSLGFACATGLLTTQMAANSNIVLLCVSMLSALAACLLSLYCSHSSFLGELLESIKTRRTRTDIH